MLRDQQLLNVIREIQYKRYLLLLGI
ncbi:MAG: DUF3967 domain-containing protein [Gammaproteobacteria bacterium]|nr:DUF3967 domain-containing protein [Gammaproteobacteria bacterium]MBA3730907.1 DUF3967 domain-containing protein [Gammaproteobacteria bacterium]